jgi:hypothetical protein
MKTCRQNQLRTTSKTATFPAKCFIVLPPLPSSSCRRFCLCRRVATAFVVTLPVLPSSSRCCCLRHRAAASSTFFVAPPPVLHLSLRCRCIPCLPLPSSSHRRWFCICRRAAAGSAFVVALPLPSLSHRCCLCHCAAARFIAVPPRHSSLRYLSLPCCAAGSAFDHRQYLTYLTILVTILFTIQLFTVHLYWRFTYVGIPYTQTDDSLTFSSIGRRKYFICTASM